MTDDWNGNLPRRRLLKAGSALATVPMLGLAAPRVMAQTPARTATKVLDFETYADVAKAEQEGALVFYCHENEAGTAAIMEGFHKDFPKIRTSYVRAQTGALYNKIISERSAGRFDVDVLQLSDIAPALDFQKRGGYEIYVGPEFDAYKPEFQSDPPGSFFWVGTTFAGIAYNNKKVSEADAPKSWKDLLDPKWKNTISCKISTSGVQYVAWYMLRQLYGEGYWKEFAKLNPRAFDSRVQLFDRLAKGDDKVCSLAEYAGYSLYRERTQDINYVMPSDGLPATPLVVGAVAKAPHPEAAKLFIDWAASNRGQKWYQDHPNLIYGSVRTDAPAMKTGARLSDFKLLFPSDFDDYAKMRDTFTREWNAMLGL